MSSYTVFTLSYGQTHLILTLWPLFLLRFQGSGLLQWHVWLPVTNIAVHGRAAGAAPSGGLARRAGVDGRRREGGPPLPDSRLHSRQPGGVAAWTLGVWAFKRNCCIINIHTYTDTLTCTYKYTYARVWCTCIYCTYRLCVHTYFCTCINIVPCTLSLMGYSLISSPMMHVCVCSVAMLVTKDKLSLYGLSYVESVTWSFF